MEKKDEPSKVWHAVLVTFTPAEIEAMKHETLASSNAEAVRIIVRKHLAGGGTSVDLHARWLTQEQIKESYSNRKDSYFVEFRSRRPRDWRKEEGGRNARVLFNVGAVTDETRDCVGLVSGEDVLRNSPSREFGPSGE